MSSSEHEIQHYHAVWFGRHVDPNLCYRAFEAYGHAMASASTFELLMSLMIMKAMALRLDKRSNAQIKPADQAGLIKALRGYSYDALQRKLRQCFTLSKTLEIGLADGKIARDGLAHNFWQTHVSNLFSEQGVDIIATVCVQSANHFRLLSEALFAETGVDVQDYISMLINSPTEGSVTDGWIELFQQHGLA